MNKNKYNQESNGNNGKFWYKVIIAFSLFTFPLVVPPFLKEGIFSGHDILKHIIYVRSFADALSSGQFPVRWIDWFVPGFGQPLFNFYQPMFYYLVQIPHVFGASYSVSLNLTAIVLWFLSGLFMFLFVKRHFGTLGGILSAAFYVFAPYHIGDIFVRAALPEFTALTFIPALFWSIKSFQDTKRGVYLFLTSVFTAIILMSHPPTMLMFLPLIVGYLALQALQGDALRGYVFQGVSIFFGFGIALSFLLPAFFEQQYIQPIFLRSGNYDFHNHFVCLNQLFWSKWDYGQSFKGCEDTMSFQLGIVHWGVVILALIFVLRNYIKLDNILKSLNINIEVRGGRDISKISHFDVHHRTSNFSLPILFLSFVFLSLYMTLPISQPIWETVPYLVYLQFPWRFLAVAVFASSVLGGSVLGSRFSVFGLRSAGSRSAGSNQTDEQKTDKLKSDNRQLKTENRVFILYLSLLFLVFISYIWYLKPAQYIKQDQIDFNSKEFLKGQDIADDAFLPELGYMPKWSYVFPDIKSVTKNGVKVSKGVAKVKIIKQSAVHKEYSVSSENGVSLMFYTSYFPGWKVFMDKKEIKFEYDNNIYGFINVKVQQGRHEISLKFENTKIRYISNILSILFILFSSSFIFVGRLFRIFKIPRS